MKSRTSRTLLSNRAITAVVVLVTCLMINNAWAVDTEILTGENNKLPNICQGAFGGSWVVAAITSKVAPPTPTGQAVKLGADSASYVANLELKLCAPSITAPYRVVKDPDPGGACHATFNQPITQGDYNNWNGVPTSYLWAEAKDKLGRSTWGELGRPLVYHFNTSADVRMLDPTKQEGAEDDAWQPDANGNITLPIGYNIVKWRADTKMGLVDMAPTFMIPLVAPGDKPAKWIVKKSRRLSETVYKTYGRLTRYGDGGRLRKVVSKFIVKKVKEGVENVGQTAVEQILNHLPTHEWRTSYITGLDIASNTTGQEVWVFDNVAPTLETNTDPATFPESLKPLITYDSNTGFYYLEAFAPRISDFTVASYAKKLLTAHDDCQGDRPALIPERIDTPLRNEWISGDQGTLRWQVADSGPNHLGAPNYSPPVEQKFEVRDSNPPILIAPPSKVVEIPAGTSSTTVTLGSPRVFDLADLTPTISNDAPGNSTFNLGINTVTWSASDYSGNTSSQEQLINVKVEGTNQAPIGYDQTVSAISYKPIDIILEGFDPDVDPDSGRHDPLSFTIKDKPANGFFVAPLLPYFIEDYRLEASALRFAGQPEQVDPLQYCKDLQDGVVTGADQFQMKYPYLSEWFSVDDDGTTVVYDQGDMRCNYGDLGSSYRLAAFAANGDLLHNRIASSTLTDTYINWRTKGVYAIDNPDPGAPNQIVYYDKDLNYLGLFNAEYTDSFGNTSARITGSAFISADNQGIVYVGGKGSGDNVVVAYQGPETGTDMGSYTAYKFLGIMHSDSNMRDIATDSHNNVFISKPDRILKFSASSLDSEGKLVPGAFIGWMGRCDSNLTNTYACDTVNHRSIGYSCTDVLCGITGSNYGSDPAQFNDAKGIAIDPHDILYVSDYGNSRVQRFTPEGDFAGEADSTGAGYGFILGDFGRPEEITVNSDHFYILQHSLLHVLQTTPVTPINDTTAVVTYQSDNNFVGTDTFTFEATDGLDSGTGTVTVNVERNYRPPEISAPPSYILNEDGTVNITLVGSDPDGSLDTLSFTIVEPPKHGTLSGTGANIVYTPDANYYGDDSFSYLVSDGVYESDPAVVNLTITSVEDPPQVTTEAEVSEGLGFKFQFPVDVFDPDADEALKVTIDWGDGSVPESDGVIMQNGVVVTGDYIQPDGTIPDDYETTGPLLDLAEDGYGSVVFEHTFTTTGDHVAQICVWDRVETLADGTKQATASSQTRCTQTTFSVSLRRDLILVLEGETSELDPGAHQVYKATITNRPFDVAVPDTPKGLDASNVLVSGENGDGLNLAGVSPKVGSCTVDQSTFNCNLGSLAFGESETIDIEVAVDSQAAGNAMLTLVANRQADSVPLLEEEAVGVVQVTKSANPPQAISLSATLGSTAGGDTVTITGQDFDADADVLFDNLPATEVDVIDAITIVLKTPAHLEGTVDVVVVNSDAQTTTLPNAFQFLNVLPADNSGGSNGGSSGGGGGGGSLDAFSIIMFILLLTPRLVRFRRMARQAWS
jgi:hypothetical protein